MKRRNNPYLPTEDDESATFASALDMMGLTFTHVNNEQWTTSWKQKARNKRLGVRRGVPDYIVIKGDTLYFCEMKRKKGGVVSDDQLAWQDALRGVKRVKTAICKGYDEAIAFINDKTVL